ncbi:MAG: twin-arginine translocase TatA/TatE family subunit [Schwartzia sp.]|nr:twin-arginine translocase TatA/TatE family subunit [Schwartzia sp. (in: firmicutes)]
MFGLGVPELVLILVIGLVVFGPGKLPEIGAAFGKGLREFRRAGREITEDVPETAQK